MHTHGDLLLKEPLTSAELLAPHDVSFHPTSCEKFTRRLIWFLLFAQAGGYTIFDTFFSIKRSNNQKILASIDPGANVWWIASLYFLVTNSENISMANNSSHRYCEIIRTHQLPKDWPTVSVFRKKMALFFSFVFTSSVAFSECVSSAYAIEEFGYPASLAYTIGCLSGTATLTLWPQLCELLIDLMAHKKSPYQNKASEWVCKLVGYPLALLSTAQVITDSYFPMVDEFAILDKRTRWGIFVISSLSAASYLSTYSIMGIEAIDALIGKISAGKCPSLDELFSLMSVTFGSAILTDLARARILSFLLSPEIALPFMLYDWMIDGIAWASALYGGTISAHNAYPYMLNITNRATTLFNTCYSFCKSDKKNTADEKIVDPPPKIPIEKPLPRLSNHRNTLFSSHPAPSSITTILIEPTQNTLKEETPLIPRESSCTRFMRWLGCK